MSKEQPRIPTYDPPKQSYLKNIYGTRYPVQNYKDSALTNILTKFRKVIAPVNPFAHQQIPSQDRIGLGPRYGNFFYYNDAYPNSITFDRNMSHHYNPLDHPIKPKSSRTHYLSAPNDTLPIINFQSFPKGCQRRISQYERCKMVNGSYKCYQQAENILGQCPNWALNGMKYFKNKKQFIKQVNKKQYQDNMIVSDYNIGRKVEQLQDKQWSDGTRRKLRPDTMWAVIMHYQDDRYANITQQEINQARIRVKQREKNQSNNLKDKQSYDWKSAKYVNPDNRKLYP